MFKVRKVEDSVNRTIRFPKSLLENMSKIAQQEKVSLNSFVVQCCEYAINDMDSNSKKSKETE